MNIDGVFLHYLLDELTVIKGSRINKFIVINQTDFAFYLSIHSNLYISLNSNTMHLRLTDNELLKSSKTNPFLLSLKKYAVSSIINDIYQVDNDRTLVFDIHSFDELGYQNQIYFILELYGKNSNFIICDKDYQIIDCFKRVLPSDEETKAIIPKSKYEFEKTDLINPFTETIDINKKYQGVSSLLLNELYYANSFDLQNIKIDPTIIQKDNKFYFYAFPLTHLEGIETHFDSLSQLLEYYFYSLKRDNNLNSDQNKIRQSLLKSIKRAKTKLDKQRQEKENANKYLEYEKLANLLSSNLHLVKKGCKKITVNNFYDDNKLIDILIDEKLSPSQNLNNYYSRYKKAKRSLEVIDEQIEKTISEIDYYEEILEQLEIAKATDLNEMALELGIKKQEKKPKNAVPNYSIYKDNFGNMVYVGKNNTQNNYLTHKLAHSNDYFFHVAAYSGSHTILRTNNLDDRIIKLASMLCLLHSKGRDGVNVSVDYTLIKYVKKVPGTFGSFVTYTNQKTTHVTVDIDLINKELQRIK